MDIFGIGPAVKGMMVCYIQSARATGRTTQMIECLKDGDRIVFTSSREARRVGNLCKERGLDVKCVVVSPKDPHRLMELGPPSKERTLFDHSWVEEFYLNRIDSATSEIDFLQRETSGYGEAHIRTKLQAEALMKWGR